MIVVVLFLTWGPVSNFFPEWHNRAQEKKQFSDILDKFKSNCERSDANKNFRASYRNNIMTSTL